jgi:hypothetical protein
MSRRKLLIGLMLMVFSGLLSGCGGGGDADEGTDDHVVAEGRFLDAAVEGLGYQSGSQSGVTGQGGVFRYEVGQQIRFSIGGITLGPVVAAPIITPVTLAGEGADVSDPVVGNIVRFMLTLDEDQDPSNGIRISDEVRLAASDLEVDFSLADEAMFLDRVGPVIEQLTPGRFLVGLQEAQQHFSQTLDEMVNALAGNYSGNFSGGNRGNWSITVASDGSINGAAHSDVSGLDFPVDGNVTASGRGAFGSAGTASFSGVFSFGGCFAGTWVDHQTGDTGVFSGRREGSSPAQDCIRLVNDADVPPAGGDSGGGSAGGGIGGQLRLTGQSELGTGFIPVDQFLVGSPVGGFWGVMLSDQPVSGPPAGEPPMVVGFLVNDSNVVTGVSVNKGTTENPTYFEYSANCSGSVTGCQGVYYDADSSTFHLTNVVLMPTGGEGNLATGNLTLNGSVSFSPN